MLLEELISGFQILLIGISVVFSALAIVAILISLFGYFDKRQNQISAKKSEAVAEPPAKIVKPEAKIVTASKPPAKEVISPEVLAVISAAVALSFQKKVRITRIRRFAIDSTWQKQGRIAIMTSHAVKH